MKQGPADGDHQGGPRMSAGKADSPAGRTATLLAATAESLKSREAFSAALLPIPERV
jgi:hypothetical protein